MKKRTITAIVVGGSVCCSAFAQQISQQEFHPTKSSNSFVQSYDASAKLFEEKDLDSAFETPGLGSLPAADFDKIVAQIKRPTVIPGASAGNPKESYDIILQPGHYLRVNGRTGASGSLVSERDLMAFLVNRMAHRLSQDGLKVLVVPADGTAQPLQTKVFLAIHADGNESKCTSGPSLGYAANSSLMPMHAVGWSLARAYGYDYKQFMKDNLTVNESHYYMFSSIKASAMNGILEVGEITCDKTEKQLIENSERISDNLATALEFVARM